MTDDHDFRTSYLEEPEYITPDWFPALYNISAAFVYRFLPVPVAPPPPPEYVYVPIGRPAVALEVAIAEWNICWEAGVLRHEMLKFKTKRKLPAKLRWISRFPERDFRLVPLVGTSRYPGYAPLYHLLPLGTLKRFGLPALKRGHWPTLGDWCVWRALPPDFDVRLGNAFVHHLWSLLCPGSPPSAFSRFEPVRILAHSLDYWLPYIDRVAQDRMRKLGRVKIEDEEQATLLAKMRADAPADFIPERPLFGGHVWQGEAEAWEATRQLIDTADRHGNLRAIVDTIRSHRVVDDFSPRWSFAKEDFERKLYRKRARVKVTFVELRDTIAVHGPEAEVDEHLLWQDFFAILNPKESQVVVCLRNGVTKAAEIAKLLGYANHSPVSKSLRRIRQKVQLFLDN